MTTAVAAPTNPYTRRIAQFVSGLHYDDIPEPVRHRIKLLILDSLGCGLYGAQLEWSKILADSLVSIDDTRTCSVWGTAQKLSSPHAVLANGSQVQGFELDDAHPYGVLHVGAVTLAPIVALAESGTRMSGKDFLTAAVAGYEIGPRVGLCMNPDHIAQGWHSAGTVGVFAAAAGASRALALDEEQTVHALGIAGTQAAGLMAAQFGAMVKRMHSGRASQSGLYGALLAKNGFTGIQNVLESEYGGFCTTFSRSTDRFDMERLIAGFGEQWETMRVGLKFYSCVMSNHTTLDGVRELRAQHPFEPEDVERIDVTGSYVTVEHVGWPYVPNGMTAAQLNLPFCIATLLYDNDVFVDQFTPETIVDPRKIALAQRVDVVEDKAITAAGRERRHAVTVTIALKDGTRLHTAVETQYGSDRRFAEDSAIVAKFEKLARHGVGADRVAAIRDLVLNMENADDASELARLLAAG